MRRRIVCALLSSAVAMTAVPSSAAAAQAVEAGTAAIVYPKTRSVDLVEDHFGIPVADPYRWLENDVRTDPEVKAWVDAENAVTNRFLQTLPLRDWFKQRMTALYDYERFGLPVKKAGHYFYTHNSGLQNQAVLFVRDGLDGTPRQVIDPNGWSADGATALAEWTPSEDGKLLAYADPGRRHRLANGQGDGRRHRQGSAG